MLAFSLGNLGRRRYDGVSRRSFLKAGAFGFEGFSLSDLLRAEDAIGAGRSQKTIINIHLDGGPPQMNLIDPKPDAPSEIRGEFSSIPTRIPGLHLSELMPKWHRSLTGRSSSARLSVWKAGTTRSNACPDLVKRIWVISVTVRRWDVS